MVAHITTRAKCVEVQFIRIDRTSPMHMQAGGGRLLPAAEYKGR